MEKKFYTDNFEQLLKESTDNFRMYPSKRVWHSIYNDLHPSRRWPSLAIWLLLISSIVFIGLSNKNHATFSGSDTKLAANKKITAPGVKRSNTMTSPGDQVLNTTGEKNSIQKQETSQDIVSIISKTGTQKSGLLNNRINDNKGSNHLPGILVALNNNTIPSSLKPADKNLSVSSANTGSIVESQDQVFSLSEISIRGNNENEPAVDINLDTKKPAVETKNKLSTTNKNITDKAWIEDYAFHNKPFASKWKSHVTYQLYFTPSVGYRILSKNTNYNPVSTTLVASANIQDYKEALAQAAAVNLELGGNILYSLSKNWNLKAGIQLNYTNYAINAYELKHPTMTTLLLNDLNNGLPSLDPRSTTLANISGVSSKKLNNNTYQISIPLGADIKLAGNNNLKWYAGATIQPTYIIGGNAYLISSDLKNYVADKSLIRKWNLNTGIETFISYKTKGGIIINAGPQFRYQILSTYSKQYTYDEKLYNLGLKVGIITRF